MDYLTQFHWWYVPVLLILLFVFTADSKGGLVQKKFAAVFQILDDRFQGCKPEADFCVFRAGKTVKLEIEVERLAIPLGEELELYINGALLAKVPVKKDGSGAEAEFEHYSDEGVDFPTIVEGDEIVIRYEGIDVITGRFELAYDSAA